MRDTVDLLIVGGGIAGACCAWYAARAGRRPVVIDAAVSTASLLPGALINPVRGYQGKVIPDGLEAARFSFDLINQLDTLGYHIPYGRGLWRPVDDETTIRLWHENLPATHPHRWATPAPCYLGLRESWPAALFLPDSGWVDGAAMVEALLVASKAKRIAAHVVKIDFESKDANANESNPSRATVTLASGKKLVAHELIWCGGAWGAEQLGLAAEYQAGSLLIAANSIAAPISHGLYASPCAVGSIVGPTRERRMRRFSLEATDDRAVSRLRERAESMFRTPLQWVEQWRGVRLTEVQLPPRLRALTGLGGRGFLFAPMLAHRLINGLGNDNHADLSNHGNVQQTRPPFPRTH